MAEYVERKAAIKAAERAFNAWNLAMATAEGNREINLIFKRQELCKAVASVFESAPAADVAPVAAQRWMEARMEINDYLPATEILAQLGEEAAELGQAALKLRRVLTEEQKEAAALRLAEARNKRKGAAGDED